jgi:hypothetical protein
MQGAWRHFPRQRARDLLAMGSAWMTTDGGEDCREILLPYLLGHGYIL